MGLFGDDEKHSSGTGGSGDSWAYEEKLKTAVVFIFIIILIFNIGQGLLNGKYHLKIPTQEDMQWKMFAIIAFVLILGALEGRVFKKLPQGFGLFKNAIRTYFIVFIVASIIVEGLETWWIVIFVGGAVGLAILSEFMSKRVLSPLAGGRFSDLKPGDWITAFKIAAESADYQIKIKSLVGLKGAFEQSAGRLADILTVKIKLGEIAEQHAPPPAGGAITPIQVTVSQKDGDIKPEIRDLRQEIDKREVRSTVTKQAQNALMKFASVVGDFSERVEKGKVNLEEEGTAYRIRELVANLEDLIIKSGETASEVYQSALTVRNMKKFPYIVRATFKIGNKPKSIFKMLGKGKRLSTKGEYKDALEKLGSVIGTTEWLVKLMGKGSTKLSKAIYMADANGTVVQVAATAVPWQDAIAQVKAKISAYEGTVSGWSSLEEIRAPEEVPRDLIIEPPNERRDFNYIDPTDKVIPIGGAEESERQVQNAAGVVQLDAQGRPQIVLGEIKWSPEVLVHWKTTPPGP